MIEHTAYADFVFERGAQVAEAPLPLGPRLVRMRMTQKLTVPHRVQGPDDELVKGASRHILNHYDPAANSEKFFESRDWVGYVVKDRAGQADVEALVRKGNDRPVVDGHIPRVPEVTIGRNIKRSDFKAGAPKHARGHPEARAKIEHLGAWFYEALQLETLEPRGPPALKLGSQHARHEPSEGILEKHGQKDQ